MFGLSIGEVAIIAIVALLVFGPEKLPELFSQLGKFSGELKKTSDGFRREFYNAVYTPAEELKLAARSLVTESSPPSEPLVSTESDPRSSQEATENTPSEQKHE